MILNARSIGGVETHVITLAEELSLRRHKVVVVSSNKYLGELLHIKGIKHCVVPVFITTKLVDIKNIMKYFKSFMMLNSIIKEENIDIIHVHGPSSAAILSYAISRFLKKPIIYTHHVSQVKRLHFLTLKLISNHFDAIIAISGEIGAYLMNSFNIKSDKIHVIYNGIKLDEYDKKIKSSLADKKLLHISRLDDDKIDATYKVIESLKYLNKDISADLTIIGSGQKSEYVRDFAVKLSKESNRRINVIGEVEPNKIKRYLYESDIVIGAGRVAIEGMAAGKPVIFVSPGGLSSFSLENNMDIIKYHNFSGRGCKDNYSSLDIAKEIEKILSNRETYEYAIIRGKFHSMQLDINEVSSQIERIYALLLKK